MLRQFAQPRIEARRITRQHLAIPLGQGRYLLRHRGMVVFRAKLDIQFQKLRAQHLGHPAPGRALEHFHLKQAIAGHRIAIAKKDAVVGIGKYLRGTVGVPVEGDPAGSLGDSHRFAGSSRFPISARPGLLGIATAHQGNAQPKTKCPYHHRPCTPNPPANSRQKKGLSSSPLITPVATTSRRRLQHRTAPVRPKRR